MDNKLKSVRIDKWLWAARFYKTRQLAIKAIKNSQISINNQTIKPASSVKTGDLMMVKSGLYVREIEVVELSEKRASAVIAQNLYAETQTSVEKRQHLREQLAQQPRIDIDPRKPDKRGIRSNRALKRGADTKP